MNKSRMLLLGLLTLCMAPIGWCIAFFPKIDKFLELHHNHFLPILVGALVGMIPALFVHFYSQHDQNAPHVHDQFELINSLNLNTFDCVFLAFCAGFGEELLFRGGVQPWIGPLITSILFVAIHGYLNFRKWHIFKYGLMVLIFILIIAYLKPFLGIWFCISAHFFYDFTLFYMWKGQNSAT